MPVVALVNSDLCLFRLAATSRRDDFVDGSGDGGTETLAELVGTTRSRVNFFMNKFRKLGFIHYNSGLRGLQVHSSLLNVVLHD